jgi:HEAT repeat protein
MIRLNAALALARFKDAADVPILVELLADPDQTTRIGARNALVSMGPLAVEGLNEATRDARADVRFAAVLALVDIGDRRGGEVMLKAMDDADRDIRAAAYRFFYAFRGGVYDPKGRLSGNARPRVDVLRRMAPQLAAATKGDEANIRLRALELLGCISDANMVEMFTGALGDADARIKLRAIGTLRRLGDKRAVEPLRPLLQDADDGVRFQAGLALTEFGDARGLDAVIAYFNKHLPTCEDARGEPVTFPGKVGGEVRGRMHDAARALGRSGSKRAFDTLIPALTSPNRQGRVNRNNHFLCQVVHALHELGDASAFEPLLPVLDVTGFHERLPRCAAVRAVAALGGQRAAPILAKQLKRKAWQESYSKALICRTLGEIGDPNAVDAIVDFLTADPAHVRVGARDGLMKLGPAAIPKLIARLEDPKRTVREAIGMVLMQMGPPAAAPALEGLKHTSPYVREGAAMTLGYLADKRAIAPLLKAIEAEADPNARVMEAWALGEPKDPGAIDGLAELLAKDSHPLARRAAAQSLGRIAHVRALEPLIAALKDTDPAVRGMSAAALGGIGDGRAVKPLEDVVKTDGNTDVRAAANEALVTIRSVAGG